MFAQVADEYMLSLEENKKTKGRRQPLSKLPRHHPLVLQECGSDDGKSRLHSSREGQQFTSVSLALTGLQRSVVSEGPWLALLSCIQAEAKDFHLCRFVNVFSSLSVQDWWTVPHTG